MNRENFLRKKAEYIRNDIIAVSIANGAGHIAPSLSCVDILVALYYDVMNYDSGNPFWGKRDRLVLSKGHGCYGLYSILTDIGLIPQHEWRRFYRQGSSLFGCSERRLEFGIEAGCGSLGHGLPIAVGIAFGAKLQGQCYHTYCVIGDGEMQEGTTWEAIQFAVKHEIGNLTIIIDNNRLQAMDFIVNILDKDEKSLVKRLKGFGLSPKICPGQDAVKIADLLRETKLNMDIKPITIVAKTTKGYGLKCMENDPKFHFRVPTDEELKIGKSHE
jgi:transketolase